VVPYGTDAHAAAPGIVQVAGPSPTGYRVWVNHGNGLRTGYFHLSNLRVSQGDAVLEGTALGRVGHNPSGGADGNHLHFEVSPVDKYAPMDPSKYMKEGLL
jgi:murein DD-endopeptidase MepM/ murein hydrolase activator NlpD